MKIITLEEHFTTPKLLEVTAAYRQGPPNPYEQRIASLLGDLGDGRLTDMDTAGIDLQVLSLNVIFIADQLPPFTLTEI